MKGPPILMLNAEHAGAKRGMRRAGIPDDEQAEVIVVDRQLRTAEKSSGDE